MAKTPFIRAGMDERPVFAENFTLAVRKDGVLRIAFHANASFYEPGDESATGPVANICVSRVVLPLSVAEQLSQGLKEFCEKARTLDAEISSKPN